MIADNPYTSDESKALTEQLKSLPKGAEFLIHFGDIRGNNGRACQYSDYAGPAGIVKLNPIPVFIIPGDNEYTGKCDKESFGCKYSSCHLDLISPRLIHRLHEA